MEVHAGTPVLIEDQGHPVMTAQESEQRSHPKTAREAINRSVAVMAEVTGSNGGRFLVALTPGAATRLVVEAIDPYIGKRHSRSQLDVSYDPEEGVTCSVPCGCRDGTHLRIL